MPHFLPLLETVDHVSQITVPAPGQTTPRTTSKSLYFRQDQSWLVQNTARYTLAFCASITYLAPMNSKHRKTLAAVFTDPVSGTIEWAAVESLLLAAGARLIEGRGSRVRFEKDGEVATFHRPHPAKEAKRYQVRDARDFLERIGVKP
jgi:hypothetical protein